MTDPGMRLVMIKTALRTGMIDIDKAWRELDEVFASERESAKKEVVEYISREFRRECEDTFAGTDDMKGTIEQILREATNHTEGI